MAVKTAASYVQPSRRW